MLPRLSIRKRFPRAGHWIVSLYFAAAYGLGMLALTGTSWAHPYAPNPFHRLQMAAMLQGHFWLAEGIHRLEFDLAFHEGQVQQVWGLGVALWMMPFEVVYRVCTGSEFFPDRLALGAAFGLLGLYVGRTVIPRYRRRRLATLALGGLWLVCFNAGIITLASGPQTVYEDASLYALLGSFGILVALVRIGLSGRTGDYWVCCVLAGLSGFVRPTHAVYGVGAVFLAILWLRRRRRPWMTLAPGLGFMLGMIAFLALTNEFRFGSPLEFGHRLTATTWEGIYLMRIWAPIQEASVSEAARELAGLCFFADSVPWFDDWADHMFPGQTQHVRWRNLYLTTFHPATLAVLVACVGGTGMALTVGWRRVRLEGMARAGRKAGVALLLTGWAAMSLVPLAGFYMYYPAISSRYLLDLWPGFCALTFVGWSLAASRLPRLSLGALVLWLAWEICLIEIRVPRAENLARENVASRLLPVEGLRLEEYEGAYSIRNHPSRLGIRFAHCGWDATEGVARLVAMMPVDAPEFVMLLVGPRLGGLRKDNYRAWIGTQELRRIDDAQTPDGRRVRFEVPESIRGRGEHLLHFAFGDSGDREDWDSVRILKEVRWRNTASRSDTGEPPKAVLPSR